jgi:hypothetical protein
MVVSSHRPAKRSIMMAGVGLLVLGSVASCGGSTNSSQQTTSQPASVTGEVRLGCGTYCQSAGGIGGTAGPEQSAVTIVSSGTITLDADGHLPVTLKCVMQVQPEAPNRKWVTDFT